jgi:hypothetical protein
LLYSRHLSIVYLIRHSSIDPEQPDIGCSQAGTAGAKHKPVDIVSHFNCVV